VIGASTVFKLRSDVRFRRLEPEGVIVRQTDPEVLVVNDLAARILETIDGTVPVGALVDAFTSEYAVDRAVLEHDVAAFLDELVEGRIIEEVSDEA
jgi:Coenzyme PQQ synthesis protein D (PqqD)